jgi:hypothetical protein
MLWHVNQAMEVPLGRLQVAPDKRPPIPMPLLRFMVLHLPWGKSLPTNSAFVAKERYQFDAELTRCRDLVAQIAARPIGGEWPHHPFFGPMTGKQISQLMAKHLNHHLTQFGV